MIDYERIRQNRGKITKEIRETIETAGNGQAALNILKDRFFAYASGEDFISFKLENVGFHIYLNKMENRLYLGTAMDIPKEVA